VLRGRDGQTSNLILHLEILQSLVFLINSRYSLFNVASLFHPARFFPKLQRNFVEFLQYYYLKRLSKIYQFTCSGFQYGNIIQLFLALTNLLTFQFKN